MTKKRFPECDAAFPPGNIRDFNAGCRSARNFDPWLASIGANHLVMTHSNGIADRQGCPGEDWRAREPHHR